MAIGNKIKDGKLQYDINREEQKISALWSGKTDKYEYLTGEEILPSDKSRITQQAKLTYSPLGKAFDKQTIEDQGMKQVEVLKLEENNENIKSVEGIFTKGMRTNEIKNEIDGIRKCEEKLKKKDLRHETKKDIYDFQQNETIRSFGENIYPGKINVDEDEMDQSNLLKNLGRI